MDLETLASHNMHALSQNPYPGRGFVCGVNAAGTHLIQIYWIGGRGDKSRNRVLTQDSDHVYTEVADPSKLDPGEDTSLILYNAMAATQDIYVVSNGVQTDAVVKVVGDGEGWLSDALDNFRYEPDEPNYTPRISAFFDHDGYLQISVLRRSRWDDTCDRCHYSFNSIAPGYGFCVTTYTGNGNPLPPWRGEPILMPIGDSTEYILAAYWNTLENDNLVSLVVKSIDRQTGAYEVRIRNKYEKVAPSAAV